MEKAQDGWGCCTYFRPRQNQWQPKAARVKLPDTWRHTRQAAKTTDINVTEAASASIALATWPELTHGLWLHFVDNNNAEQTLVKGSSSALGMNTIANYTWRTAAERHLYLWVDRVSTHDNPTDGLSRGDFSAHREKWELQEAVLPDLH